MQRLGVDNHRHLPGEQEIVRDVPTHLPLQHGLQQEGLSHDGAYGRIKIGEEKARQLKP